MHDTRARLLQIDTRASGYRTMSSSIKTATTPAYTAQCRRGAVVDVSWRDHLEAASPHGDGDEDGMRPMSRSVWHERAKSCMSKVGADT